MRAPTGELCPVLAISHSQNLCAIHLRCSAEFGEVSQSKGAKAQLGPKRPKLSSWILADPLVR